LTLIHTGHHIFFLLVTTSFLSSISDPRFRFHHPKMAAASLHVDPTATVCSDGGDDIARTVSVSLARLRHLEACQVRADLQERHIQLLQKQIDETGAALKSEVARGEKHAEVLMHIARSCDDRVDELKVQHAGALRIKDDALTALTAELEAVKASQAEVVSKLEGQVAVLQAQTTLTLTDIQAAIAARQALEIHPVRSDYRQFAEWHTGPVPALPPPPRRVEFDRDWCIAACGATWEAEIDAKTSRLADVTKCGGGGLTLRSAAPLPRRSALAFVADKHQQQQQQLPMYRIVNEAHYIHGTCRLGFVPSHRVQAGAGAPAAVIPIEGHRIWGYGGWHISVHPKSLGYVTLDVTCSGWSVLKPSRGADGDAADKISAYATTDVVPPVPPGSGVEFAVDYAAGTCRVAFYTPAAVAGGFVQAPHAKMELRFLVTAATTEIPARSVPTLTNSGMELYPAVETTYAGATWRLAS
jgi:hypothetical protein